MKTKHRIDKDRLEKNLLVLASCIPERHRRITAIMKYAFFGQFEGYFPSIGKSLRYHGAYSPDLARIVAELEGKGLLERKPDPRANGNNGSAGLYAIPADVARQIPAIADHEGIDFARLAKRMRSLFADIGFRADAMGAKSREYLYELVGDPERYLFADDVVAPDVHRPLALAKLPADCRAASRIASFILRHKEHLPDYTFDGAAINRILPREGFVFLGGHFTGAYARKTLTGTVVEFSTSVLSPRESAVPVLLGAQGRMSATLAELPDYDCIVVGRLVDIGGRPTVQAAGVIQVGVLGQSDIIY